MGQITFPEKFDIINNEPLSKHSSFKIGGNAKFAAFPKTREEFCSLIGFLTDNNERYIIIGNGSNVLFDDLGYDGTVIFTKNLNDTEYIHSEAGICIRVGCGKLISELALDVGKRHSLSGLEFAYGIPGSLGGAVFMNAGAYGHQISDVLISSECFDTNTKSITLINSDEHLFSYRKSIFQEKRNLIVLSSTLRLKVGSREDICTVMDKYLQSRIDKQPLEYPSAGSVFKRPGEQIFAGKLIEDAGLKGFCVNDAAVSEKHAGFIINRGSATATDVLELIDKIKQKVLSSFGINLECEIIYIPYK